MLHMAKALFLALVGSAHAFTAGTVRQQRPYAPIVRAGASPVALLTTAQIVSTTNALASISASQSLDPRGTCWLF